MSVEKDLERLDDSFIKVEHDTFPRVVVCLVFSVATHGQISQSIPNNKENKVFGRPSIYLSIKITEYQRKRLGSRPSG
jgi:hypothetical protein